MSWHVTLSGEKESATVVGSRSGRVLGYLFLLCTLGLAGRGFPRSAAKHRHSLNWSACDRVREKSPSYSLSPANEVLSERWSTVTVQIPRLISKEAIIITKSMTGRTRLIKEIRDHARGTRSAELFQAGLHVHFGGRTYGSGSRWCGDSAAIFA